MTATAPVNPFRREGPPRKSVVAGSVSADEKALVQSALHQAGFPSESEGVREIMLAYVESAAVRDAIHRYRTSKAA